MKTLIRLIVTFFISTICLVSALGNRYSWILYLITFAVWTFFFWTHHKRLKGKNDRAAYEQLFQEYMRSKIRRDQQFK